VVGEPVPPEVYRNALGCCVAALRRHQGWTQQAFADAVGVSQATLSRWERGTAVPDAVQLRDAAGVLSTTVADLSNLIDRVLAQALGAGRAVVRDESADWNKLLRCGGGQITGLLQFAVALETR